MTDAEPQRDDERADAYVRRTGHYPPDWTPHQCQAQDACIHEAQLAGNHAYLRRWGALGGD